MPCEPAPGCAHLLPHGSDISYDAPGPFQHPLPLGSKALKTRATPYQHDAQLVFQLFDGGGERWLRYAHLQGCLTKMLFLGQGRSEEHTSELQSRENL